MVVFFFILLVFLFLLVGFVTLKRIHSFIIWSQMKAGGFHIHWSRNVSRPPLSRCINYFVLHRVFDSLRPSVAPQAKTRRAPLRCVYRRAETRRRWRPGPHRAAPETFGRFIVKQESGWLFSPGRSPKESRELWHLAAERIDRALPEATVNPAVID